MVANLPEQKGISLMEAWTDWFGESEYGQTFRNERDQKVKER